jgi:phosphatidate cytidylyltransferase
MNKELITRGISGLVFLIILTGSMMLEKMVFSLLFLVFTFIGLKEFIAMLSVRKHKVDSSMIYLFGICTYLFINAFSYFSPDHHILEYILPFLIIYPVYALINLFFKKVNDPGIHASILSAALLIAAPFGLLNFLFIENLEGIQPVLAFFILLWSNDTFAYLTGKFLGKHKLMQNVSPKKTWEGFIGGIAFAILAGFLLKEQVSILSGNNWIFISIIVGVFGTMGDLYESRIKRWAGVKDSGQIMPGHGGVLDRFDGVMFSVVFVLGILYLLSL